MQRSGFILFTCLPKSLKYKAERATESPFYMMLLAHTADTILLNPTSLKQHWCICILHPPYRLPSLHFTSFFLCVQVLTSQNHRIIEWPGVEGTPKTIKLQPPRHRQGCQPPYLTLDHIWYAVRPSVKWKIEAISFWGILNLEEKEIW